MSRFERDAAIALVALIAAFWPVWQWLAMRATHDPTDAWPLLSLATAVLVLWRDRSNVASPSRPATLSTYSDSVAPSRPAIEGFLVTTIALLLIYLAIYRTTPPLVRAILALTALATTISPLWWRTRLNLPLWGLLLLSLPWVATLNFYLGYPLRAVVGELAAILLRTNTFDVERQGTLLMWAGRTISIDAPCSGVKMLWTGMYLSCALAALHRLSAGRTVLLGFIALGVVIAANVLRATSLFFVEAYAIAPNEMAHTWVGVFVFVVAAIGLAFIAANMRREAHAR